MTSDVRESDESIRILLTTSDDSTGAECAGVMTIVLTKPLGSRPVVDRATGERIEVLRPRVD